jgi:hypothetical protein
VPRNLFRPVAISTTGARVRFDTASGSDTPADVTPLGGGASIINATVRSDSYSGGLPSILGPDGVMTLYQKTLSAAGAPTGEVITLTGSLIGSSSVQATNLRSTTSAATAQGDDYLLVDATSGPLTITAPAPVVGVEFTVEKTDATANIVTVFGSTFDGNSSVQFVAQNAGATFVGTGSSFRVKSTTVGTVGPQGAQGTSGFPGLGLLGFEPLPRTIGANGQATVNRGAAVLVIGQCYKSATVTTLRATPRTGSAGATLARMGIYSLPDTYGDTGAGPATLVARTASNTSMFGSGYSDVAATLNTTGGYPAAYSCTAGPFYALALVVVGGTVDPQYFGTTSWGGIGGLTPAVVQQYGSQPDLATSYTISSANAYIDIPWIGAT